MNKNNGKLFRKIRIATQVFFLFLFFFYFFSADKSSVGFFYFDPLILFVNFLATGTILFFLLLSLLTIVLTLIFGRVFCGWVCPFGSINQFFTWIFKKKNRKKEGLKLSYLRLKYFILIAVLVSALVGTNLGGWLDPFALLTRSTATLSAPANYLIKRLVEPGEKNDGIISKGFKPIYDITQSHILAKNQRSSTQSIIIPGLFFLIIGMNYYKRRFFCNSLCPLGALLGFVSRISLFKLEASSKCNSCEACSRNCTYNGNPDKDYIKSECMVCFNCVSDCPSQSIDASFNINKNKTEVNVDLGRRNAITTLVSGAIIASLPKASIQAMPNARHNFIRPPGAICENDFLEKCIRCGCCVQSCTKNFIQPALLETGVEGIWTPILNAQAGFCAFDCNKCTLVCSTMAIQKLTLKEKQSFKIGTAVINKNSCYTYANGFNCTVCYDKCPTPQKAIQFHETETWSFFGKTSVVNQVYVLPDLCIGCGICEYVCPRKDFPAIFITSEDEVRESVTGDVFS